MKHLTHHQFSASLDGVLQSVPSRLMESHLASCIECRGRWDGFVTSQRALTDLLRHDGPPEFHAALAETLDRAATPDEAPALEPPAPHLPVPDAPATVAPRELEWLTAIAHVQAPAAEAPVAPTPSPEAPSREVAPSAKSAGGRHMTHHQLSASLDGELMGVSGQLVERHLAVCEACRRRSEGFRGARDTMVALLHHGGGPEFEQGLERILDEIATRGSAPAWLEAGPVALPAPEAPALVRAPAPRPATRPAPIPAAGASPKRTGRERAQRSTVDDPALSRAWMLTAIFVLAAVAWVSWILWDYHRSSALRPATGPATASPAGTVSSEPVPSVPPAAAAPAPAPAPQSVATAQDSVASPAVPSPPMVQRPEAPRVERSGRARATVPDPAPAPVSEPTASRAEPAPAKPAVSRPAPARDRPAAPRPTPVPKQAVAAPVLGLLCGQVSDENHQPVVGARVLLADLQVPVATDRNGGFCVSAPLGERTVSIVALGFETSRQVVVVGPQTLEILVTLRSPAPATPPR